MSRLDSLIKRFIAQRACLNHTATLIAGVSGPVFELGLGNGRTFDHLRENCGGREIFVFERKVAAHPDCIPDPEHLYEGALEETLETALARFQGQVAMVHADLGSGRRGLDDRLSGFVAERLAQLLAPRAVVASDQDIRWPGAEALSLPEGVNPGRYHLYRNRGSG